VIEINTNDYLRLIGITPWVVSAPEVFSAGENVESDIYVDNQIYLGKKNSRKVVMLLLAPTEREYIYLAKYLLQSMFKSSLCQVAFVTNHRDGTLLSEEICKYSQFTLLKSKECNIVKENSFEVDMKELSVDISYKRQVMLDVFKVSDYTTRS
jgi:hypothetical protein